MGHIFDTYDVVLVLNYAKGLLNDYELDLNSSSLSPLEKKLA